MGVKDEKFVKEDETGSEGAAAKSPAEVVGTLGGSTVELERALRLFRTLKAWRASVADVAVEALAKGPA